MLCEKPAGVNENELQEMIECAKRNNVFFMEGMWTRFFPISQQIKEIVKSKKLGEVRHINAEFGYGSWADENIANDKHRLFSPDLAGGALLDVGIYPIAYTTWLKDKDPKSIASFAKKTPLGVDGSLVGIFEYDDNCTAMFQCSVCQKTSSSARVYFDDGKIELERFYCPHQMKITYADGTVQTVTDDFENKGYQGFIYEINHVADCISKGLKMSPIHTWDEALKVIKIMDTMREQIGLVYPFE